MAVPAAARVVESAAQAVKRERQASRAKETMAARAARCRALLQAVAVAVQAPSGAMHRQDLQARAARALRHHSTTLPRHALAVAVDTARQRVVLEVPAAVAPVALSLRLEQPER